VIFKETKLKGAYIIELEAIEDPRGYFARSYCKKEFSRNKLDFVIVQCDVSHNNTKGTLRGMHYQAAPHREAKLVSCIHGAMYDVIVDLRPESDTYRRWFGAELTEGNRIMIYVPVGFAHGFQTLEDETTVYYQMSEYYHAECARGLRWDDPSIKISWPSVESRYISDRDLNFALLEAGR